MASWLWTAVLLLYAGGARLLTTDGDPANPNDVVVGNPVGQALFAATYALALGWLLLHTRRTRRVASRSAWPWAMVALIALSVAWSAAPPITARRAVGFVGTTIFGLFLAVRYEPDALLKMFSRVVTIVLAGTIVLALFVPELGLMTSLHEGAWRGPFSHKNILSRFMVLGAVVYYLRSLDARAARRWGLRFGIAACVAVVILARSATALVVLSALALAVVPLSRLAGARPSYRLLVPAITVAALLATGLGAWALENRAIIFAALGRDETLTGRTLLWSGAIELARQRPWLGYGYGGFWSGESGAGGTLWRIVQWDPTHAHNGLLDVWLDLGLVGVVVFATGAVALWLRALGRAGLDASPAGRWPLLFLSYILAYSLTESDLLRHNGLLWALFVATALAPHRSRGEHSVSGETGAVPGMRRGASLSRWRRHRSTPSGHRSQ